MKVLVVVDHAVGISGPHRNVVGSLNALTARDDVSVVLLTKEIDADEPYARSPNLELHVGFEPHNPRKALSNIWRVSKAAKDCDVAYVPSGLKSMLYAQFARWRRPLVVGPNITPLPLPSRRHDSPGMIELKLLSDVWFEASEARMRHVHKESGNVKVGFVHHALDIDVFSPRHRDAEWKARIGAAEDATIITYVGRDNSPLKGVSQLVRAVCPVSPLSFGSGWENVTNHARESERLCKGIGAWVSNRRYSTARQREFRHLRNPLHLGRVWVHCA